MVVVEFGFSPSNNIGEADRHRAEARKSLLPLDRCGWIFATEPCNRTADAKSG